MYNTIRKLKLTHINTLSINLKKKEKLYTITYKVYNTLQILCILASKI